MHMSVWLKLHRTIKTREEGKLKSWLQRYDSKIEAVTSDNDDDEIEKKKVVYVLFCLWTMPDDKCWLRQFLHTWSKRMDDLIILHL